MHFCHSRELHESKRGPRNITEKVTPNKDVKYETPSPNLKTQDDINLEGEGIATQSVVK